MNHITGLLADKYSDRHLHGQMDRRKTDIHTESQRNQEPDRQNDGQTEQNTNLLSQFTPVPTNKPPDRQ